MEDKLLKTQREYRLRTNNASTKRYEKTPKGYLMRKYRNMQSRVTGVQKKKAHLYEGLPILDRDVFYKWALSNSSFWKLFNKYESSGYDRKLAPTVNRIDSDQGYILGNMRWLTHSENSRLGSYSRFSKKQK